MHHATLCYVFDKDKILLGMKKKGFGQGKLNGYGGKVENGESFEAAAIRETKEESGLDVFNLKKVAELDFKFTNAPPGKDWDQVVHVYFTHDWKDNPIETDEMSPKWYDVENIPIEQCWDDDKFWLPKVIEGKKIYGWFIFGGDNNTLKEHKIQETSSFKR
jgi:8-oxo-dGTP pyrophosphatase MutT (NUDIX family)